MSIYYSWKLGLVGSLFIPIILVGVYLEQRLVAGEDSIEKSAFERSAQVAIEAISNIRTVVGIQCEQIITDKFTNNLGCKLKFCTYCL